MEANCHFGDEKIQQGHPTIGHVRTGKQLATIFTKALVTNHLSQKLKLLYLNTPPHTRALWD